MEFLVPNYSCLQNPWLGGYRPQIPVLCVLCPQLNLLNPSPPTKFLVTPLISTKRKQLDLKLRKFYWIIVRKPQLALANNLLAYKTILKPIWTYGVQLWGSASNCNVELLEIFQSKMLRIMTDAPWFVSKAVIIRDLKVLSVRQEVRNYSVTYRERLNGHPNSLAKSLLQRPNYNRRFKRYYPADLATRFNR